MSVTRLGLLCEATRKIVALELIVVLLSSAGSDANCAGSQLCGSKREQQEIVQARWRLLVSSERLMHTHLFKNQ